MKQNVLEKAISLAINYHRGQQDKAGRPYILHVLQVMMNVPKDCSDEIKASAVLHDSIEDVEGVTAESLLSEGIPQGVVDTVLKVTKLKGESPEEYLAKVLSSKESCIVKLADLSHNMDLSRIENITEKDLQRMKKYRKMKSSIEHKLETFTAKEI